MYHNSELAHHWQKRQIVDSPRVPYTGGWDGYSPPFCRHLPRTNPDAQRDSWFLISITNVLPHDPGVQLF